MGTATQVAPILIHNEIFPLTLDVLNSPQLPVRAVGIVHVSQSWRLLVPIPVDAPVLLTTAVVEFRVTDGDAHLTIASAAEQGGGLLYVEKSHYLAKRTGLADVTVSGELRGESGVVDLDTLPEVPALREKYGLDEAGHLDIGQASRIGTRTFGAGAGRAWARISGDVNPIHLSTPTAIPFGYRRPILHGAAVEGWVESLLGLTGAEPAHAAIAFRAPLQLANSVEAVALDSGEVAVVEERTGRDLVHVSASADVTREAPSQIVFPRVAGRRSASDVSRSMFRAAAGDGAAAATVDGVENWRKGYRDAVVAVSELDAPQVGVDAATRGLDYLATLSTAAGTPIGRMRPRPDPKAETEVVAGEGALRPLTVPLRGSRLAGSDFVDQVATWAGRNMMTSAAAARFAAIAADPERLDLRGRKIAVIGAGAELAPTRFLLGRGAEVYAVIRPDSARLPQLVADARTLAGRLYISPVGDVVVDAEGVAGWLLHEGVEAIAETLYAPGAQNLLASIASDAVIRMVGADSDILTGWLGSPMDAYFLPEDLRPGGSDWQLHPLRGAPARFGQRDSRRRPAMVGNVYNGLLNMQGPSYAAAKRIGRWRATERWAAGQRVSYHVAPMATTRSVTDASLLRAAYAGMEKLGISPIPAETTAVLMGALFAADLVDRPSTGEDFLVREGFPSGLWARNTEPESVLVKAVLLGSGAYLRK